MKTVFDIRDEKLNDISRENQSSWKYIDELNSLKNQLTKVQDEFSNFQFKVNEQLSFQEERLIKRNQSLNEQLLLKLDNGVKESNKSVSTIVTELNDLKRQLINKVDGYDKEHTERDSQIYNAIEAINQRVDRFFFDVDERSDHYYVHYENGNGKKDFTKIKKLSADNKTLVESNGKLKLAYNFSLNNFDIKDNVIYCTGLRLNTGRVLSSDRIQNDLHNATFNVSQLNEKVESILRRVNTLNGYVASNNFKKADPSQTQLTNFAIECLPSTTQDVSLNSIPTGTKIKNTFDNHIWVLNRITLDGLTTAKWEDFGADSICVASNDGVHGLVTGSSDKLKGHIDLKGVISINGLEEELTSILESLLSLSTTISNITTQYDKQFLELESRIRYLEENR